MAADQVETRAEAAAHGSRTEGGNPVTDFIRNSPFLFLSLLFHVIVLSPQFPSTACREAVKEPPALSR